MSDLVAQARVYADDLEAGIYDNVLVDRSDVALIRRLADRIEELTKPKPKPKRRSGLKRDAADARWSKMVRERAGMRCQFMAASMVRPGFRVEDSSLGQLNADDFRCSAEVGRGLAPQGLHAAHCFTRGNPRTRLDPDNGLAMCFPHHREIDSNKALKFAIFTWWLGESAFDALQAKANARRDRPTTR